MSYSSSKKSKGKKTRPDLKRRTSIEDTRKLFKRNNTQPLIIGNNFDGGFRDDYYHKSFTEEAQKAEKELFFNIGGAISRKKCSSEGKKHEEKSELKINDDPEFDQDKVDKILVATCMLWDDSEYDTNISKLKLLVDANADISTSKGGGMWRESLLVRMMFEDEKKKRLQLALIKFADRTSLEPKIGKTPLSIACSYYKYDLMKLLLDRNCEPNRIAKNGMTPLISICRYDSRKAGDEYTANRLRCLELLVNYEGPDAKELKERWAIKWDTICPNGANIAWRNVADYCIPNINVRPTFKDKSVLDYLQSYDNPSDFDEAGLYLIGVLCTDAVTQKEKYWPGNSKEYLRMFDPDWARDM